MARIKDQYAMYLRKSRKDKDLEDRGMDTLQRHEKILRDLAEKMGDRTQLSTAVI